MSNLSLRPPRRTLYKTNSTPLVMADAFARADLDPSDFPPASSPMPELRSQQPPDRVNTPIPINVSRCISLGVGVSGKVPALDLHGCNQDQAYERLEEFIRKRHGDRCRVVRVITGKGSGTLKRLVPQWLEVAPFKEFVAETRVAEPWNGGEGALSVCLR